MSVEQLEQSLLKLGPEERRNFADWFFEHEGELLGEDYIHPEVKAEILRRHDEAMEHPELLDDFEKGMAEAKRLFDELRRKDSQAG